MVKLAGAVVAGLVLTVLLVTAQGYADTAHAPHAILASTQRVLQETQAALATSEQVRATLVAEVAQQQRRLFECR